MPDLYLLNKLTIVFTNYIPEEMEFVKNSERMHSTRSGKKWEYKVSGKYMQWMTSSKTKTKNEVEIIL